MKIWANFGDGRSEDGKFPTGCLYFEWHDKCYFGAAHGISGIFSVIFGIFWGGIWPILEFLEYRPQKYMGLILISLLCTNFTQITKFQPILKLKFSQRLFKPLSMF